MKTFITWFVLVPTAFVLTCIVLGVAALMLFGYWLVRRVRTRPTYNLTDWVVLTNEDLN